MKDPKRYLETTENQMLDINMMQRYQTNSTPAVSCNSLSSGATRGLQHGHERSYFSRSLRKVVNLFTRQTQSVSEEPINVISEQNVAPETALALEVQQPSQAVQHPKEGLQQPKEAIQQPAQVLQQPTQAQQQSTQSLQQPTKVLQHPTQAQQQPGDTGQQQFTQGSVDTIVQQQPEQALDQPAKDELASQRSDELPLQQLAKVQQQAQPEIQSTEAVQQLERNPVQSVPLENDKAVNEEKKVEC